MKKLILLLLVPTLFTVATNSQNLHPDSITVLEETIFQNDTIPFVNLDDIYVYSLSFANSYEAAKYRKYRSKVEKVYPYAQMAKEILADIEEQRTTAKRKRHVKKYTKNKEKDLRDEFEQELKNLTVSEGKILVSLINRETGNNCYRLIKELKGGMAAFFWQKVAKRYGYNLKDKYDPAAPENFYLEYIVSEIEGTQYLFYGNGG